MKNKDDVKRCLKCKKILVSDSKVRLCPRCADEAKKIGFMGVGAGLAFVIKKGLNLINPLNKL